MNTPRSLDHETLEGIQDLIQINLDSHEGFLAAAEEIHDASRLPGFFRECAQERQRFANELAGVVGANAQEPADSGSLKGAAHRWWLGIRAAVQSGDEHAILAEAERGEDAIKHRYERVLKKTAGSPVNDMLQRQYAGVKRRHDQVRDMRDARA